jgi:hypothetical protein
VANARFRIATSSGAFACRYRSVLDHRFRLGEPAELLDGEQFVAS